MSKLSRQNVIRELVEQRPVSSQDELRRLLARRGHAVTQATLSRDIRELALVKTAEGYAWMGGADEDYSLPSLERLVREFVFKVTSAQNIVVLDTSAGSAQPVAAALDAEEWPEVVGTVGGDDTIFIVAPDNTQAAKLVARLKGMIR
jgi:transcriptional regulator of arginine metabolism